LVCTDTPEAAAGVVAAAVLWVGVLAGVEAELEVVLELLLLLPQPASSATAAIAAAPSAMGRLNLAS
jgi:hypothetical protein